ncbi:PepSY domain-containing protein [Nesterenkonia suensis]
MPLPMTPTSRLLAPRTVTGASVATLMALSLTACGPDDPAEEGEDTTVTIGEDSDAGDDTAEDTTQDGSDDGTDDAASSDSADADHPAYGGLDTVQAEHPDGVVFAVEADDGLYEWHVLVEGVEREVHTDQATGEIVHTEDDDAPDGDDLREIEAIQVDFAEALRAAEEHADDASGVFIDEAELDTEDGVVVWEIELDNGHDLMVDVTSAEVLDVDD